MKHLKGTSLIEILVATGVISLGVVVLFQGFIQASRNSTRNATTEEGLHILNTRIDADARRNYVAFGKDGDTIDIPVSELPEGKIVRTITCVTAKDHGRDPNCHPIQSYKTLHYVMTWNGADGAHTLKADHVLVNDGLLNRPGVNQDEVFDPIGFPAPSPTPSEEPTTTPSDPPTDPPCADGGTTPETCENDAGCIDGAWHWWCWFLGYDPSPSPSPESSPLGVTEFGNGGA